jgi:putative ABC transport system permease protein
MIGYLRTLLLFYRRHLRVQPLRELMAIAGIAAGVALLFAVQVAHHSITGSFEEIAHGVAGNASIEVAARSPEGVGEGVAEAAAHTAGVKAVAPILAQPIVAVGPDGRRALTLVGATEQVSALHGALSSTFQRAGESSRNGFLLLTQQTASAIGARVGGHAGRVTVLIDGRREEMALAAILPSAKLGAAAGSPIAAAPLPIVQAAAGLPQRVNRVLVQPRPGQEAQARAALARRLGAGVSVRSVDAEARLLGNAASAESEVTLLFSMISLVAGVILAYNALLLASEERRRFVSYLIETGTPDSMVLASLLFDALILGLAGCALGLLAGEAISLLAYQSVPGYVAAAFPIGPGRVVVAQTILIAIGGGMLAALAAALLPALAILRSSAIAEPEATGCALSFSRRLRARDGGAFACGLALIGGSLALALLAPGSTVGALVALAAGIVICLPMAGRCLLALARRLSRRSGDPAARLAVAELRGAPTRAVALLATGTIAAFLMVLIGGSVADVQGAVRRGASGLLQGASLWVRPGGATNVYTTEPFAYEKTEAALQRLPVVASVSVWRDSFLDMENRRVWVLGVPATQRHQIVPSQLLEGSLASADRRLRAGGWAALSQTIAREEHLHLGQRFTLPTPSGQAHLRLAAITANYGWLSGAVVMSAAEHARLWGSDAASELAVNLKPGVPAAAAAQLVRDALPPGAALSVQTSAQRRAEVSAVLGSTLSRLSDTTIVVLVTSIASVIALMLAAVWQSRGRFNSLISIGMGAGQFARLIFYESGTMLLAGCLIGIGAGIVGQDLIDGWLQHTTGSPVQFDPAWLLGLRTVAIALGICMLASLIAAVRVTRFQPNAAFSMR